MYMNSKMERSEKLVWVVKNSFLIIGVASWLLIPLLHRYGFLDLLLLLHRYSFFIPFALWLCKKEVVVPEAAPAPPVAWLCKKEVVVPQAAPAPPVASSVENFYDFLFFQTQEEEEDQQQREYCDVDEPSAASQGAPAWWLSEPVLMVGKEAAAAAEFSWDGVVDSTVWMGADVAPSAPPIATAYSASFFDECCGPPLPSKAEGGWEDSKSMEELWEAICAMKEEKGRRRRTVKEEKAGGGRRKREVPAPVKKDELFQQADAFIKKQRHAFRSDLQLEESPVRRPRRAVELDRRRQLPRP